MRLLLLLALLGIAGCAEARPSQSAPYAVALTFNKGVCSATKVGRNIVLGAAHCFDAGRLTEIDGEEAHALEIVRDGQDHVLVRVTTTFTSWAVMGPEPKQGDRLTLTGNIWGVGLLYRELVVAGEVSPKVCPFPFKPCRMILAAGVTDGGDSGAGYFDSRGRLVGVHTGVLSMRDALAVIVPFAFTADDWREIRS